MKKLVFLAVTVVAATVSLVAAGQHHKNAYVEQQQRAISSLSDKDVEALRRGRGWGLAKPAEFNKYPGPMHVLELAEQLALTAQQRAQIEQIFRRMKRRAQALGQRYISSEARIDALFRDGGVTEENLRSALREADGLRSRLREVHLRAHLQTTPLLTRHQRHLYGRLRGYSDTKSHSGHAH